jgi:two-component system, chemotaxis family, sensor kinase CheA
MSVQLAQYRDLYFSEAHEQLDTIADALRKLERAPGDRPPLDAALRATHTLKGMSAMMGYDEITTFAHAFEDLIQSALDHFGARSTDDTYPLFRTLGHLNKVVSGLESGHSPEADALAAEAAATAGGIAHPQGDASSLVRLRSEQLDRFMGRIVELLASANRLPAAESNVHREEGDTQWREHLALIRQLQAEVWSLRMAPISEVFNRFPPMLHELARAQGKEIRVSIQGSEIEVGRKVLEEVGEPLLHLLRNAVTHGIEPLPERLRAGKDPRGTVMLHACQRGDSVILEVGDDGRGLDAQHILQAAHERGFISEAELRSLSGPEAYELIMLSGFSMAPAVTHASGRGVGLDIVRTKVATLQGTIHTRSQPGLGTSFILELPLVLGAIPVELVRVGHMVLAVPAAQIESKRVLGQDDLTGTRPTITSEAGLPLHPIYLRSLFHLPPQPTSSHPGLPVIITRSAAALHVDEFLGRALWTEPSDGSSPAVPLFNPDQPSLG